MKTAVRKSIAAVCAALLIVTGDSVCPRAHALAPQSAFSSPKTGRPTEQEEMIRYLTTYGQLCLDIRNQPALQARVRDFSARLQDPALYDAGSPIQDYATLKRLFINNYGQEYADDLRLAEEFLVVYRTGSEVFFQPDPVQLVPDPTKFKEGIGLPSRVDWLAKETQMLCKYPYAPQDPAEIAARKFVLATPLLKKYAATHRGLVERYGYKPWRDLYQAAEQHNKGQFKTLMDTTAAQFTPEELNVYWPGLVEMGVASKKEILQLFQFGLPVLRHFFQGDQFLKSWLGIVEAGKKLGSGSFLFYHMAFPFHYGQRLGDKLYSCWPAIVQVALEAGDDAFVVLFYGLPALFPITSGFADMKKKGREMTEAMRLMEDVGIQFFSELSIHGDLAHLPPSMWGKLILPTIRAHKSASPGVVRTLIALARDGTIKDPRDFRILRMITTQKGVMALDIINNFIAPAVKKGVIKLPIYQETNMLREFLSTDVLFTCAFYKEFKQIKQSAMPAAGKKQDIEALAGKNRRLLAAIRRGSLRRAPADKDLLAAGLTRVFPPSVTVDRQEYLELFEESADHVDHVPAAVKPLQNREIGVKEGKYVIREGESFDRAPWNTLQTIAARENARERKPMDLAELGLQLGQGLENAMLRKEGPRQELLTQLYLHYCRAHAEELPDSARDYLNAMVYSEFAQDMLVELVGDTLRALHKKDAAQFRALLAQAGCRRVEEMAGRIAGELMGSDREGMERELSKWEYRPGEGTKKLSAVISKRKAHVVAGFNMGICTARDKRMWNKKNFFYIIFFNEKGVAQGGGECLVIQDRGKRYLALSGVNPTMDLLKEADSQDVLDQMIAYAQDIAACLGLEKEILIPSNSMDHSNRLQMQQVIKARNFKKRTLLSKKRISWDPEILFRSVFVVPAPSIAAAKNLQEDLNRDQEISHAN